MASPYKPNGRPPGKPPIKLLNTKTGEVYPSIKKAAAALGVSASAIETRVKGRSKKPTLDLSYLQVMND